jgi:hypothetical protein
MYSLRAAPIKFPSSCKSVRKVQSLSKRQAVQGIGDVVHINVYETFSKRLDSIDEKLLQIEEYLNIDPPVKIVDDTPIPLVITQKQHETSSPNADKISELEAQIAEASSEARRNALKGRIMQLSA